MSEGPGRTERAGGAERPPEADEAREGGSGVIRAFVDETLPRVEQARRGLVAGLFEETLTQVGSSFSKTVRMPAEIDAFADAMADMFTASLATQSAGLRAGAATSWSQPGGTTGHGDEQ